jgi:hypothetical protein
VAVVPNAMFAVLIEPKTKPVLLAPTHIAGNTVQKLNQKKKKKIFCFEA